MIDTRFLSALNIYTRKQETLAKSNNAHREVTALASVLSHVHSDDISSTVSEIRMLETVRAAIDVMQYAEELDHFRVRCIKTGKIIGTLSCDEVSAIFAMHSPEKAKRQIAIAQRRVSPMWLSTDNDALEILQLHDPRGYTAYLLGLWFRRCDPRLLPGTVDYVYKDASREWDDEQRFIYDTVDAWFTVSETAGVEFAELLRRIMTVSNPSTARAFKLYDRDENTRDILAWDVFKTKSVFDAVRVLKNVMKKFVNFARGEGVFNRNGTADWEKLLSLSTLLGNFPAVASQHNARAAFNAALMKKAKDAEAFISESGGTGRFLIKPKTAPTRSDNIKRLVELAFTEDDEKDVRETVLAAKINAMDFDVEIIERKPKSNPPPGKTLKQLMEEKRNANPAPMQVVAVAATPKPVVVEPKKALTLQEMLAKAKAEKAAE